MRETLQSIESAHCQLLFVLYVYYKSSVVSTVKFVDLSGRNYSDADRHAYRLSSAQLITKSWDHLHSVINTMHNNYQNIQLHTIMSESLLTTLLRDCLMGNACCFWIISISECIHKFSDSLNALIFMKKLRTLPNDAEPAKNSVESIEQDLVLHVKVLEKQKGKFLQGGSGTRSEEINLIQEQINAHLKNIADLKQPLREYPEVNKLKATIDSMENIADSKFCVVSICKDTCLSGRNRYSLGKDEIVVGSASDAEIPVPCIGIHEIHCKFKVVDGTNGAEAILINLCEESVRVNGTLLSGGEERILCENDVISIGLLLNFQLVHQGVPGQGVQTANWVDIHKTKYANSLNRLIRDGNTLQLKLKRCYIHELEFEILEALIAVEEANAISNVLQKHEVFDVEFIRNNLSGGRLNLMINVRSTESGNKCWSKEKLYSRLIIMREMWKNFVSEICNENIRTLDKLYPKNKDPFHDPPPDVLLGKSIIFLNALRFLCSIDNPISIIDLRGRNEGELMLKIIPTVYSKNEFGVTTLINTDDESQVDDIRLEAYENETLQINFKILGISGLRKTTLTNLYAQFRWYNHPDTYTINGIGKTSEENRTQGVSFSENVSPELIEFLKKEVIEVGIFYRQEVVSSGKSEKALVYNTYDSDGPGSSFIQYADGRDDHGSASKNTQLQRNDKLGPEYALGGHLGTGSEEDLRDNLSFKKGSMVDSDAEKEQLRSKIFELEAALERKTKKQSTLCNVL